MMEENNAYDFCKPYLMPGEMILWRGKPEKGFHIGGQQLFLVPFSLIWLAFSLFWEFTVITGGGPPVMVLFGLPFVAVGLFLLFGQALRPLLTRGKTYYVITDQKVLVRQGNRIQMVQGEDLPPMDVVIHRNGTGSIYFSQVYHTRRGMSHQVFLALENLSDVARAQNALSQLTAGREELQ